MHTNIPGRAPLELPAYYESFAWYYPNCEMQTKDWFVRHAGRDWTYLDCGANIGYYSILFSQLSPQGRVRAIEPTVTADMLEKNLRHHGCTNVTVDRVAFSDRAGRRKEKVFRLWGQPAEDMEYDFTTVDAFVTDHGRERVDCLKIDVDSFDFEVLQGAEQTLRRCDPWILIELSESLALRGSSPEEVLHWLSARGYQAALVLDKENFLLKRQLPASQDSIPLGVLSWALAQRCLPVLQREMLQMHRSPAWACSTYPAQAMEAAAADPAFAQSTLFRSGLPVFEAGQLLQYAAVARHFAPDLTIEFGGWRGATTPALAFGLHTGGKKNHRLLSWRTPPPAAGLPSGASLSPDTQFSTSAQLPATADLPQILGDASRILVFSNDPSPEGIRLLLGGLLPALRDREHLVILHGISDGSLSTSPDYTERPDVFALQDTWSARKDLPQLLDFIERNQLDLFSASRAYQTAFGLDTTARDRLQTAFGGIFPFQAHWRWFSFNGRHNGRYLFPPSP